MKVKFSNRQSSHETLGSSNVDYDWDLLPASKQLTFLNEFNMGGCKVIFLPSDLKLLTGLVSKLSGESIDLSQYILKGRFDSVITRESQIGKDQVVYLEGVPAKLTEKNLTETLFTVYKASFIEAIRRMVKA